MANDVRIDFESIVSRSAELDRELYTTPSAVQAEKLGGNSTQLVPCAPEVTEIAVAESPREIARRTPSSRHELRIQP